MKNTIYTAIAFCSFLLVFTADSETQPAQKIVLMEGIKARSQPPGPDYIVDGKRVHFLYYDVNHNLVLHTIDEEKSKSVCEKIPGNKEDFLTPLPAHLIDKRTVAFYSDNYILEIKRKENGQWKKLFRKENCLPNVLITSHQQLSLEKIFVLPYVVGGGNIRSRKLLVYNLQNLSAAEFEAPEGYSIMSREETSILVNYWGISSSGHDEFEFSFDLIKPTNLKDNVFPMIKRADVGPSPRQPALVSVNPPSFLWVTDSIDYWRFKETEQKWVKKSLTDEFVGIFNYAQVRQLTGGGIWISAPLKGKWYLMRFNVKETKLTCFETGLQLKDAYGVQVINESDDFVGITYHTPKYDVHVKDALYNKKIREEGKDKFDVIYQKIKLQETDLPQQ